MRLATWNVNSVKARLPRLLEWLAEAGPDVVGLQETKVATALFPAADVAELGYEVAAHGDGRWNGVALLSRVGLEHVSLGFPGEPGYEAHYAYKLAWYAALRGALAAELEAQPALVAFGDFNVAPTDADVWDPAVFVGSTHVTPAERQALADLRGLGLRDVVPAPMKGPHPFTYWDYRAGAFAKDQGMRIDLVYATQPVADRVRAAYVDREARKGHGPSDHAPIVVDLD